MQTSDDYLLGGRTISPMMIGLSLFVLFFLALFVPWAKPRGGLDATIASVAVAVGLAFFNLRLEFLWSAQAAFVAGIIVVSVVSLIPWSAAGHSDRIS